LNNPRRTKPSWDLKVPDVIDDFWTSVNQAIDD
jgi:hypothetical protein